MDLVEYRLNCTNYGLKCKLRLTPVSTLYTKRPIIDKDYDIIMNVDRNCVSARHMNTHQNQDYKKEKLLQFSFQTP